MTPPHYLTGRSVLVTGASSGLGLAFALRAADAGAKVALCARRGDMLTEHTARIRARGGNAVAIEADVTEEGAIVSAFDQAEAAFGLVNSVVASAGINLPGKATDLSAADLDKILAVNIRGTFLTVREGARRMIASGAKQPGEHRILLIGSVSGVREGTTAMPKLAAYCASKAAVDMLGKAFAREWVKLGINVNVVHPGSTLTEMNAKWAETEQGIRFANSFPRKSLLNANHVTSLMLFLVSDGATALTGGQFIVDDGQIL
jgi:NAD(P)-dependent dehydrogenase (short-subunit alcohol dehydrogenase family)